MPNAEPIDPRDTSWEIDLPVYRVYFWRQQPPPPGIAQEAMGYASAEYRLTGVEDVDEVLAWARRTAEPEQTFTLYVEHRDGDLLGLIRLAGIDPTGPRTT